MDKTSVEIPVGRSVTLNATVLPEITSDKTTVWSSSDISVASVENGFVKAIKMGKTTIQAACGAVKATCEVIVTPVYVETIIMSKTTASLKVGETLTLTATVSPGDATEKMISWTTSDEAVAMVSNGVVMAKGLGSATITAEAGGKKTTCAIAVEATSVSSVTLDRTSASLKIGEVVTLTATVNPDDATDKIVSWTSSDEKVATVINGVVMAKGLGAATITAEAGGKKATCAIAVEATSVSSVTLDRTSASLKVGEAVTLTATVNPDDATDKTVSWASSDNVVAMVSNGVVMAKGLGEATITAEAGGKKATCVVSVVPTKVESVSLDKNNVSLLEGETVHLVASVYPSNASYKAVRWSSSNTSIATVDAYGKVIAVHAGNATITATTEDGGMTASCEVTVLARVAGISLNKSSITLERGDTETLTATISPANAYNKEVSWSSSDTSVATVDAYGKVTAVKAGTATITATTKDGGKTATCEVTVLARVSAISLNKSSVTLYEGETETLTANISPANASNKDVSWSSSNTSVATVDAYGKVTAIKTGTATITVTTKDGGKTATCEVTVLARVSAISLNRSSMTLCEGGTETLTATISPANASNKDVSWSSSNTSVATVDAYGKVTAMKAGTATITATTKDGGKTATCEVTVLARVTAISMNKSSMTLYEGSAETLTATISPANAYDKNVSWSSSNTSVATVDTSGKVTAVKVGTTTITVTTKDGGKTATCEVTVVARVSAISLNKSAMTLEEGISETLAVTISPANAYDKNVSWSSSNTSVATVDASGKVTAVKVGTATITVTTKDGGKTASCAVTVVPCPVESVRLNKTSLELKEGTAATLIATVNPDRATNKKVSWSSSDTSIATVSASGVVSAKEEGTAVITVKTEDGNKTAKCTVIVIGVNSIGEGGDIVIPNSRR